MRFYLAAKFSYKKDLLPIAAALTALGHVVQAKWIYREEENEEAAQSIINKRRSAIEDFDDIEACNGFILFNFPVDNPEKSSGRHVELGFAIAHHKAVFCVGKNESIFATLADVNFDTVEQLLEHL